MVGGGMSFHEQYEILGLARDRLRKDLYPKQTVGFS
jgi:hypothetical protein